MAITGRLTQLLQIRVNPLKLFRLGSALVVLTGLSGAAFAQTYDFELNPQQSHVSFTLGDVLHTVHGTFQIKSGSVRFDTSTATASGLIVVEAASGDSGSKARDHKMHKEILESDKFPDITFAPQHIRGQIAVDGKSQVAMDGLMTLHGQAHAMSITVPVEIHSGAANADLNFLVPYVQWGLKNPSTFLLKVSDKVDIAVHAVGRLQLFNP